MMTFAKYCVFREGLWLNDRNAVVGLSKVAPPAPPKKPKPIAAPKIKPVQAPPPPNPVVKPQFPDALTMMQQLGISPVEHDRDQMKRLVDRAKKQIIIPPQSRT